jgi:threonine/homoserine/homoserine lactone efflux protein
MPSFLVSVVVITASGALAPGPLFFANITQGVKSGAKSGLAFSISHSIIEFSLIMLLALGVFSVVYEPSIKFTIGVAGGIALVIFGFLQIRSSLNSKSNKLSENRTRFDNPFLIGFIFTSLNPYFILWWLTAGLGLILNALTLASWTGIIIMYITHVWMDYAWLTATAYLAKKGTKFVGSKGYKIMIALFGIILIFFGFYFFASAF